MNELIKSYNTKIVLDANIFLNLYNYPYNESLEFLSAIELIKDKIWLPYQVIDEFRNNKNQVTKNMFSQTSKMKREVETILLNATKEISEKYDQCEKFKYPLIRESLVDAMDSLKAVKENLKDFDDEIKIIESDLRKWREDDLIEKMIARFIENTQVSVGFKYIELLDIYKEGNARFDILIPPGYKDSVKSNKGNCYDEKKRKYGDLIIWKDVLREVSNSDSDILFVTDDMKPDWWEHKVISNNYGVEKKVQIGAHPLLLEEFNHHKMTDNRFVIAKFDEFINTILLSLDDSFDISDSRLDDFIEAYISSNLVISDYLSDEILNDFIKGEEVNEISAKVKEIEIIYNDVDSEVDDEYLLLWGVVSFFLMIEIYDIESSNTINKIEGRYRAVYDIDLFGGNSLNTLHIENIVSDNFKITSVSPLGNFEADSYEDEYDYNTFDVQYPIIGDNVEVVEYTESNEIIIDDYTGEEILL